MGKFLELLNKKLTIAEKPDYVRQSYQTYMTGPEWRNVEMAEEYAQFIKEGNSMFCYPYFTQISDLWGIVFKSYSAAREHSGHMEILTSEYMLMDVFIAFFTTMELMPKGLLSLVLGLFLNKKNNTEIQQELAKFLSQYAEDLQTIPFYDHSYKEIRANLSEAYRNAETKTWGDWFSWKCISMELFAKHWVSKPLKAWLHSEGNSTPATTDVLVKYNTHTQVSEGVAKQEFMGILEKLKDNAQVVRKSSHEKTFEVIIENSHIYTKAPQEGKAHTSVYAVLRAHRYKAFLSDLSAFQEHGLQVKKIAGQDHVQVKCELQEANVSLLPARQAELQQLANARFLYSYGDRLHPSRQLCLFDVPVNKLGEAVDELNTHQGVQVVFIHNF